MSIGFHSIFPPKKFGVLPSCIIIMITKIFVEDQLLLALYFFFIYFFFVGPSLFVHSWITTFHRLLFSKSSLSIKTLGYPPSSLFYPKKRGGNQSNKQTKQRDANRRTFVLFDDDGICEPNKIGAVVTIRFDW